MVGWTADKKVEKLDTEKVERLVDLKVDSLDKKMGARMPDLLASKMAEQMDSEKVGQFVDLKVGQLEALMV
jgi:hypothetical protein